MTIHTHPTKFCPESLMRRQKNSEVSARKFERYCQARTVHGLNRYECRFILNYLTPQEFELCEIKYKNMGAK